MKDLSKVLEKVFNVLGNMYITDNFDAEPFEFRVNVRKGNRDDDLQDYIVEVYSTPNMPESFNYKSGKKDSVSGIHISVLGNKFRELMRYVDSSFGEFRKTVGIRFMNAE